MSLKSSFSQLTNKLDRLREEFLLLKALGVDDQPEGMAVALQDAFADALEDIIASINSATDAAHQANQSLTGGIDISGVLESLTRCNESWNRVSLRYWSALNSYEGLSVLMELGRTRGGEWQAWTRSIEAGLNKCSAPMLELNQAIFECWREIGEAVLVAASLGQPPGNKRKK
jgi:hypothetical protein